MSGENACPNCGAPTAPGQRFCKECGAPVPAAAWVPPPQAAPGVAPPPMAPGVAPPPGMGTYAARPQISLSSIPLAEILVALCALITTILTSTKWYKLVEAENELDQVLVKAWPQWLAFAFSLILLLFAVAMIANRYLHFMGDFPTWPAYLLGGILILIFCILPTFLKPASEGDSIPVSRMVYGDYMEYTIYVQYIKFQWGMFVASVIFTLGIIAGGLLKAREETG